MRSFLAGCLTLVCGSALFAEPGSAGTSRPKIDYSRDIKPILSNHCFACHGPDPKALKAGLRLDLPESAMKALASKGIAVVPGKPEKSELVARIRTADKGEIMPPPSHGKPLSAEQKDLLQAWIAAGAEYQSHWAFVKPVKGPLPATSNPAWAKGEIDAFILNRLDRAGIKPAGEADKQTLIRRVSLDLRGLPPTLQEVEQFLADKSPAAYEAMIDRMLASPRYGEKMAQLWLDLARFGDTSGYHYDSTRQMWMWRDYVINSFNTNKPFDRFTIEQLAGDLLPNPTTEQKIATGFNRNSRFNEEGGADPEEFVIRYNVDRTNTLGQTWLGLTLGCAECHTHKYDPISHKEYYQLFAFFAGIQEPMASGNHGASLPPLLKLPTPEQEKNIADAKAKKEKMLKDIATALAGAKYEEPKATEAKPPEPKDIVWVDDGLPKGAAAQGDGAAKWQFVSAIAKQGKMSVRRSGPGTHQDYFTGATEPLTVNNAKDILFGHVFLDPKDPPKTVMLQWNDGTWEHRAYWGEDKAFLVGSPDSVNHRKAGPLPKTGEWVRLEVTCEQVGLKPGAKINGLAFTQADGTVNYDAAGIRTTAADERYLTSLETWETKAKVDTKIPGDVQAAIKIEKAKRTPAHLKTIREHYLRFVYSGTRPTFEPLQKQLDEADKTITDTEKAIPYTLVTEEMPKARDSYILIRGDFLQKGEKVGRGVPAVFPPLKKSKHWLMSWKQPSRLDLAEWVASPEHPLTARVFVNRMWAQMFGTGIVKTLGDFGTQGEYPSHPELLDWLAADFVQTGWDVKKMFKKIALSNTYRQSSAFSGTTPDVDPNNRLLYRAPRFRISAEEVRDNALAISGLLSPKVGGPSVMPYQPGDFYKGRNENWAWSNATGEEQYRRGLYAFWRRTSLHPMFALFDAPSREECAAQRPRTNTPLQALVTLNDPTFVESARVFAQQILTKAPADTDARLTWAFRTAVTREPSPAERAALKKQLSTLLDRYKKDKKSAEAVVRVGQSPRPENLDMSEQAAWTGVCNVLLNLDETLTRE